jgi:hypothetical protein
MLAQGDYMDTTDRTILKRFILGIAAILLIGVIIWVFFFRDDTKKPASGNTRAGSTEQAGQEDAATGTKRPAKTGSEIQGEAANSSTQSDKQQPDTLANTGPGNVALLFTGATALGVVGHHLYVRRRHLNTL